MRFSLTRAIAATSTAALVTLVGATAAVADPAQSPESISELVAAAAPDTARVVDLAKSGDDLEALIEGVAINVPYTAADAITLTDTASSIPLSFQLPHEASVAPARMADSGDVVYVSTDGQTDVVIQALALGSVRVQTVSNGPDAPTAYTYTFDDDILPVLLDDGSVSLTVPSGNPSVTIEVGALAVPWAYDATKTAVPTWYEVQGNAVLQHVEHGGAGVQYPVVADPEVSVGLGTYWHFNRAETATWASYGVTGMGVAGGACAAVGALGGPIVSVAIGAACGTIAARMIHAAGVAQNSSPKKCFFVRMTTPAVLGISAGTYNDSRCR